MSTPGIDHLKELNIKIAKLLEDPNPGLFTWRACLYDAMQDMYDTYISSFPKEVKDHEMFKEFEERIARLEKTIDAIRPMGGGR